MNDEIKKIIGESYKRLPFDLKKAIVSSETRQRIQVVAEKHRLNSDQAADLEIETALVMLGLRSPTDFITNIKNALEAPVEKARVIAEDINAEIFRPVRESLKKIHGITSTDEEIPQRPGVIPPPIPKPLPPPIPKPPAPFSSPLKQEAAELALVKELPKPAEKEKTPLERTTPGGHYENGEDNLNREEILAGIENPVPARTASEAAKASLALNSNTGNLVQDKLSGMVRMPLSKEEVRSTNYEVGENSKESKEEVRSKKYEVDPYQEPLK